MPESTDVLVVGGGTAACMAAIEAAMYGVRVTLVDKGLMGRGGSSPTGDAAMSAAFGHTSLEGDIGQDNEAQHYEDTLRRGEWIAHPTMVAVMAREAMKRLDELEAFGVHFSRTSDNLLYQYRTLGHTFARCCSPVGGGHHEMEMLRKEVLHRRVRVIENTMVTRILLREGEVAGVYAMDVETGEERIFPCKAAVIAAGSATRLYPYTSSNYHTTGEGFLLGHEAGAKLCNMEFVEFTVIPKVGLRILSASGTSPFMGRGSKLFNARGERFLERWDPEQLERTTRAILTRAIYKELVEERGPVYNDASGFTPEIWDEFEYSQGQILHKLRATGIDPRKERFEWVPAVHTYLGGILTDERTETGVPGLFASGESATGVHGANRLSDNAISECLVFGKRSGRYAAKYARNRPVADVPAAEVATERNRIRGMYSAEGEDPRRLEKHIRETAWRCIGVERTEKTLRDAASAFDAARKAPARVRSTSDLLVALEANNLAAVGNLIARSGLMREESRGQHFREDFPEKRDEWLRWITHRRDSEKPLLQDLPAANPASFEVSLAGNLS